MTATRLDDGGRALPALRLVESPRAVRKLALMLAVAFALLPVALGLVSWQQNVPGLGRVVAQDPLDRTQIIPAPVTGRLVRLNVQEGSFVQEGDVLAEMEDQDPLYSQRLEQQNQFAIDKVEAARDQVEFYDQQLQNQQDARRLALDGAQFELNVAIEKIKAEENSLEAAEAELEQKRTDRERKWRLFQEGVVSELDYQKAEAAYLSARAKVEESKAKVEQARNAEQAKLTDMGRLGNDLQAKIESTRSLREEARSKAAAAEKELTESLTKLERQKTQTVLAPRTGYVLRVHAAGSADFVPQGDPLIELIPETDELAVELWVSGNDAPLITPGREVRLQFEGWPAVQFAGWPSVAVGTFGGIVKVVDRQGTSDGRFRLLVVPNEEEPPWPDETYLRQGVRADGWVLLDSVRLGYEIWRQLNAFPPSVRRAPSDATGDKAGEEPEPTKQPKTKKAKT